MESIVGNGGAKAIGLISASMSQISSILGFCKVKPAVNSVEVQPHKPDSGALQIVLPVNHLEIKLNFCSSVFKHGPSPSAHGCVIAQACLSLYRSIPAAEMTVSSPSVAQRYGNFLADTPATAKANTLSQISVP